MEKFLVLYRSQLTMGEQMAGATPDQMKASMDEWMAWGSAAGESLVDWGVPTAPINDQNPGPAGWIGGYSIVQAADADAALALLADHPHQRVGTIEVLKMLPMPGA